MMLLMTKKPNDKSTDPESEPKYVSIDTREYIRFDDLPDEDLEAMAKMRVKNDPKNLDHLFE